MNVVTEGVDIEKMAAETGISLVTVKSGLGMLSECSASTLEEARVLYGEAKKNSEAQAAAQEKIIETLLERISNLATFEGAKAACMANHPSIEVARAALSKWIDTASTGEELKWVCEYASVFPDLHVFAIQQWFHFCWKQRSKITTAEEAKKAFVFTPANTTVQTAMLEKWLAVSTTVSDLQMVYMNAPEHSKVRKLVLEKLATFFPA